MRNMDETSSKWNLKDGSVFKPEGRSKPTEPAEGSTRTRSRSQTRDPKGVQRILKTFKASVQHHDDVRVLKERTLGQDFVVRLHEPRGNLDLRLTNREEPDHHLHRVRLNNTLASCEPTSGSDFAKSASQSFKSAFVDHTVMGHARDRHVATDVTIVLEQV